MADEKTFTQEEVNKLVGQARLEGKEIGRKEFEGFISPDDLASKLEGSTKQISDLNKTIEELTAEKNTLSEQVKERDAVIAQNEKDSVKKRVAVANGIPYELADKLSGDTEEEITADAIKMAAFLAPKNVPPLANPEARPEENGVMAAFKKLNPNIKL